ncbi:hypothetical protein L6452_14870 [Arctium lappa]|uniref:Uncharacterized protein n=1 Tax=Arctium lappa TaxID=4217 RepID=A0ACB9CM26_ARCLA|nr:hypothetical protein L6452_14870 [Arctium lappa]
MGFLKEKKKKAQVSGGTEIKDDLQSRIQSPMSRIQSPTSRSPKKNSLGLDLVKTQIGLNEAVEASIPNKRLRAKVISNQRVGTTALVGGVSVEDSAETGKMWDRCKVDKGKIKLRSGCSKDNQAVASNDWKRSEGSKNLQEFGTKLENNCIPSEYVSKVRRTRICAQNNCIPRLCAQFQDWTTRILHKVNR